MVNKFSGNFLGIQKNKIFSKYALTFCNESGKLENEQPLPNLPGDIFQDKLVKVGVKTVWLHVRNMVVKGNNFWIAVEDFSMKSTKIL